MGKEIDRYTYRITWSEEDQAFVGLCTEFPSLSYLDKNQDKVFGEIRKLVGNILLDMAENGETPPEPLLKKKFSGKLSLRITPEVHRKVALKAAEAGVSLNRYISSLIG